MKSLFDGFISYKRDDSIAFTTKLNQKLTTQGLNVWFDQEDILLAVDYMDNLLVFQLICNANRLAKVPTKDYFLLKIPS